MFATVQLVIAAVAFFAAQGARAQVENCARNYTVHLGDTCNSIADAQGIST